MVEFKDLETNSVMALYSIKDKHAVNFDRQEIRSNNLQIYEDRMAAEQWRTSNETTVGYIQKNQIQAA